MVRPRRHPNPHRHLSDPDLVRSSRTPLALWPSRGARPLGVQGSFSRVPLGFTLGPPKGVGSGTARGKEAKRLGPHPLVSAPPLRSPGPGCRRLHQASGWETRGSGLVTGREGKRETEANPGESPRRRRRLHAFWYPDPQQPRAQLLPTHPVATACAPADAAAAGVGTATAAPPRPRPVSSPASRAHPSRASRPERASRHDCVLLVKGLSNLSSFTLSKYRESKGGGGKGQEKQKHTPPEHTAPPLSRPRPRR